MRASASTLVRKRTWSLLWMRSTCSSGRPRSAKIPTATAVCWTCWAPPATRSSRCQHRAAQSAAHSTRRERGPSLDQDRRDRCVGARAFRRAEAPSTGPAAGHRHGGAARIGPAARSAGPGLRRPRAPTASARGPRVAGMPAIRPPPRPRARHGDVAGVSDRGAFAGGVGPQPAARLVAELGDPAAFRSAGALAAYIGLVTPLRQSSKRNGLRPGLPHIGHASRRAALWMPRLTAGRQNAWRRAYYQRLRARGKLPKVALVAAMRKTGYRRLRRRPASAPRA